MKTLDDIQLISIYNRNIIKENTSNQSNNPLSQSKIFKINKALMNLYPYEIVNPQNIVEISKHLMSETTRWKSIDGGFLLESNPVFKLSTKIISIGSLSENYKIILNNTQTTSQNHLNYEVCARGNPLVLDENSFKLKLIFDNNEPKFEVVTNNKSLEGLDANSTFIPKMVKAGQIKNLIRGVRAY